MVGAGGGGWVWGQSGKQPACLRVDWKGVGERGETESQ